MATGATTSTTSRQAPPTRYTRAVVEQLSSGGLCPRGLRRPWPSYPQLPGARYIGRRAVGRVDGDGRPPPAHGDDRGFACGVGQEGNGLPVTTQEPTDAASSPAATPAPFAERGPRRFGRPRAGRSKGAHTRLSATWT